MPIFLRSPPKPLSRDNIEDRVPQSFETASTSSSVPSSFSSLDGQYNSRSATKSQPPLRRNLREQALSLSTNHSSSSTPFTPEAFENQRFGDFAANLPFTLTFNTINYPPWAAGPDQPLPYLPVPLTPLPGIPPISDATDATFSLLMNNTPFLATLDTTLADHGYGLTHRDIWKVYAAFTHKDGRRERLAVTPANVGSLAAPWAKDVWLGHLDMMPGYCRCKRCAEDGRKLGHAFEVEVVFPLGSEGRRFQVVERREMWDRKEKKKVWF